MSKTQTQPATVKQFMTKDNAPIVYGRTYYFVSGRRIISCTPVPRELPDGTFAEFTDGIGLQVWINVLYHSISLNGYPLQTISVRADVLYADVNNACKELAKELKPEVEVHENQASELRNLIANLNDGTTSGVGLRELLQTQI